MTIWEKRSLNSASDWTRPLPFSEARKRETCPFLMMLPIMPIMCQTTELHSRCRPPPSAKKKKMQKKTNQKRNSDWSFWGWTGKKKWIACKVRIGCYCYCLNPQLVPSHSGDVWANLSCGHKSRRRWRLCGHRLWEWSNCPVTDWLPVCLLACRGDHTGLCIMFSTRPKCLAESELWALRVCVGRGVTLLLMKKESRQCIYYLGFTLFYRHPLNFTQPPITVI